MRLVPLFITGVAAQYMTGPMHPKNNHVMCVTADPAQEGAILKLDAPSQTFVFEADTRRVIGTNLCMTAKGPDVVLANCSHARNQQWKRYNNVTLTVESEGGNGYSPFGGFLSVKNDLLVPGSELEMRLGISRGQQW